jgi:TusA-related sulfurtransferase
MGSLFVTTSTLVRIEDALRKTEPGDVTTIVVETTRSCGCSDPNYCKGTKHTVVEIRTEASM